jgi:hypothetical protein
MALSGIFVVLERQSLGASLAGTGDRPARLLVWSNLCSFPVFQGYVASLTSPIAAMRPTACERPQSRSCDRAKRAYVHRRVDLQNSLKSSDITP